MNEKKRKRKRRKKNQSQVQKSSFVAFPATLSPFSFFPPLKFCKNCCCLSFFVVVFRFLFLRLLPSVLGLRRPRAGLLLGTTSTALSGGSFFLLSRLIWVAVEEEIHWNLPWNGALDFAAEAKHFTREQPVDHADGVAATVVARNRDVDVLKWGVSVAQRDDWDVDLGGFTDGLVVGARISDDQKAWLLELGLDLVREGTWDEATSGELRANVLRELEDGALTEQTNGRDHDVLWVFNRGNDASGKNELFPGHVQVDHVNTLLSASVHVLAHVVCDVLGAEVAVSGEKALRGGFSGVENLASGWD